MATWRKVIVSGSSAVLNQISASGNIVPTSDNGADLGSSTLEWKDLYIDGTAYLDSATITAGTISGITDLAIADGGTGASTLNDLITMGTHTTGNYVATITGGTGIDSDGATSGESIAHSLTLDLNELGTETAIEQADFVAMVDATDDGSQKITFSNLEDEIFGNVSGDATVAAGGALTIAATSVEGSMLNDNVISGQGALGGASVAQADLFMMDDGPGTLKKVTFSNLEDSIFGNVSGDATVAAGGALTIAATSVENSMLADDAVDSDEIASGAVDDDHLSDGVATGLAGAGMTATSGVMNVIGTAGAVSVGADAVTLVAANTTLTSILNASLGKIGTAAAQEYITFGTANEVNTFVNNTERLSVTATGVDITGVATVSSDLTVGGNLDVNGTLTTIDTANSYVADKFMIIASGSTSDTDGGIIVQGGATTGYALGYDSGVDRWAFDANLAHNATDLGPDAYVGVVQFGTAEPATQTPTPTYGGTTNGIGTIYVDTDDSTIWIYS